MVGTEARMRPSSVMLRAVERHVEVGADEDALAAPSPDDEKVVDVPTSLVVRASELRADEADRSTRRLL
jgi:hypothetical protein